MKYIFPLVFLFVVSGCATSYQPQSFSGGYSETQLDTNVFRVTFQGNGYTNAQRAEELALLRSAELTLNNGYSHFAIVDGSSDSSYGVYTTPTQTYTTGSATAFGNTAYGSATSTTTGGQSFLIRKPSNTNTIVCFNGKPNADIFVYDAQIVYESLSKKYDIK